MVVEPPPSRFKALYPPKSLSIAPNFSWLTPLKEESLPSIVTNITSVWSWLIAIPVRGWAPVRFISVKDNSPFLSIILPPPIANFILSKFGTEAKFNEILCPINMSSKVLPIVDNT